MSYRRYPSPHFLLLILLLSMFATSCQLLKRKPSVETEITSRPQWTETSPSNADLKRLVIIGTNDFHGNLDPSIERVVKNSGETVTYQIGGAPIMARYFEILHKRYPGQLLKVDAGDIYSGTLISNLFFGKNVVEFYDYLQYDALTLGNHEFDYGPIGESKDMLGHIKQIINNSKVPFITSNVTLKSTQKTPHWRNLYPYLIKTINGIKVAIIGATTLDTAKMTQSKYVVDLNFNSLKDTVIKTSQEVKSKGAQVVVLLIHEGAECDRPESWPLGFALDWKKHCHEQDDPLPMLLDELPANTIDAAVSGHSHSMIAYFYNGVPVIQSQNNGHYFGQIELFYDTKQQKVLNNQTIIHPPTKFCHTFFDSTKDCHKRKTSFSFDKLEPATFLGEEIYPIPEVDKKLAPYRKALRKIEGVEIVTLGKNFFHSLHENSELGTLVADALRFKTKADVGFNNSGSVRTLLPQGFVSYGDVYKVAPFDNDVMTVRMTGKELKLLVAIATSGQDAGMGNFSGLKITLTKAISDLQRQDVNSDGRREEWEINRVVNITFLDGSPIDDKRTYTIATNTFVGDSGGDNYGEVFNQIPKDKKNILIHYTYRDALIDYLHFLRAKHPKLLSGEDSYWDFSKSAYIWIEK